MKDMQSNYLLPWSKDGYNIAKISAIPEEGQGPKIWNESDTCITE